LQEKTVFILCVNLFIILLFFEINNITLCAEASFFILLYFLCRIYLFCGLNTITPVRLRLRARRRRQQLHLLHQLVEVALLAEFAARGRLGVVLGGGGRGQEVGIQVGAFGGGWQEREQGWLLGF